MEVYPERVPREELPFGYGYAQVAVYRAGDVLRLLAKPEPGIPVEQALE